MRADTTPSPGVFKEAMCYGPLHQNGKRLPVGAFLPDTNRINGVTELCAECLKLRPELKSQPKTEGVDMTENVADRKRKCEACGEVKGITGFPSGGGTTCRKCVKGQARRTVTVIDDAQSQPFPTKPVKGKHEGSVIAILIAAGIVTEDQVAAAHTLAVRS